MKTNPFNNLFPYSVTRCDNNTDNCFVKSSKSRHPSLQVEIHGRKRSEVHDIDVNTTYLYPSYRLQSTTIQSSLYFLDYKSQLLNFYEMHLNERATYAQASKKFWTILTSPHSAVLLVNYVNLQQCLLERCGLWPQKMVY